jgi:hypothetical protein
MSTLINVILSCKQFFDNHWMCKRNVFENKISMLEGSSYFQNTCCISSCNMVLFFGFILIQVYHNSRINIGHIQVGVTLTTKFKVIKSSSKKKKDLKDSLDLGFHYLQS